ncbi:putative membrane protein [Marmoricola sp. URHA0025 HA25]
MLDTIFGLPMHPLIVHATVVIVPAAALLVALAAVYPRFRTWIGPVPVLAALLSCVLVPLSTGSGEELQHRVGETSLVQKHADLAETLIWFVIPLAVIALVGYWLQRRGADGSGTTAGKGLAATVAVAAVLLSGATLVDVGIIGHSGAKASWSKVTDQPAGSETGDSD